MPMICAGKILSFLIEKGVFMKYQARQQRHSEPEPLRLTERDWQILYALYRYRYLSSQQIQRLFFPSLHRAYARLRLLYDHALVERLNPLIATHGINSPLFYVLEKRGFDLVCSHYQLEALWKRTYLHVSNAFLAHNTATHDCQIAVELACQQQTWQLLRWDHEADLRAQQIRVPLSPRETVTLIPDSYCQIQIGTRLERFFFEIDMATMSVQRFQAKGQAYLAYRHLEQQLGRSGQFHMLTICSSKERLDHLRQALIQVGGDAFFHFAQLADLQQHPFYPTPIWQTCQRAELGQILDF